MAEFTGPFTDADFLVGSLVTFTDVGTVLQDHEGAALCSGRINGAAIPGADGWHVPVWTERDHGREATTMYVDSSNIVSIAHPEPVKPKPHPPSTMRQASRIPSGGDVDVFDGDELAMLSLAVLGAVRGANFRRDLDPLDVEASEVQIHGVTGHPAVLVTLSDGRRLRLILDPMAAR